MNDKIRKIIFNYNLQMPCEFYNKYIIEPNIYTRMIVSFGLKNNYISNAKELYDYYIFLNCMDIIRQNN